MSAQYDGPGEYTVSVLFRASARITVQALSRDDACDKAMDEADEPDSYTVDDADILSVKPLEPSQMADFDESDEFFERVTGLEWAYFALNGRWPDGTYQRIKAECAASQ